AAGSADRTLVPARTRRQPGRLYVVSPLQQMQGDPSGCHRQPVRGQPVGEDGRHRGPGAEADAGETRDQRGLDGPQTAGGGRGGGDGRGRHVDGADFRDSDAPAECLNGGGQAADVGQGHQRRAADQQGQLGRAGGYLSQADESRPQDLPQPGGREAPASPGGQQDPDQAGDNGENQQQLAGRGQLE